MANSAAMTVIAAATTTGFQPKIGCSPDLMITTSTTLKPTNVNNVPISGSSRPRNPNWARDWIICGNAEHRPLRGVGRHEQRAERDPCDAGDDAPVQRQPWAGANDADCERERLEVPDEPERPLMADPAVAFVFWE